jgi:orotidine-5'-phosphate decarboxylase
MNFFQKLQAAMQKNRSLVCVGLDVDTQLMPEKISVLDFNKAIIAATSDLVCCYKPNLAFYEALGEEGMQALEKTLKIIPSGIPVIADAKRGDIGNTSKAYAKALFEIYGFDATTVNPYLGSDSVEPFLQFSDKAVFILCRTSNTGAADFQSLPCRTPQGIKPLYEVVAEKASEWNKNGNVGLVGGATYPEELKTVRQKLPDMTFLIPGIGAQGGDVAATIKNGAGVSGDKAVINSSRQILYASRGSDFAEAARRNARHLRDEINRVKDTK